MRKGKSSSVDHGEGAKEEEEEQEAADGGDASEEGGADGEAAAATQEGNDKEAEEKTAESGGEAAEEPEKTPVEAAETNGETGCSNGMAEENVTENHQEEEEQMKNSSPMKKSKEGVKDDANAKIINATAAVNSGELERIGRDSDEPQSGREGGGANSKRQQDAERTDSSRKQGSHVESKLAHTESREEEKEEGGEAESPQNGGCDQGGRGEEEEMRKRDLREAAVAIVQTVMSAATVQLERELSIDNGFNGHYKVRY